MPSCAESVEIVTNLHYLYVSQWLRLLPLRNIQYQCNILSTVNTTHTTLIIC